MNAEISIEARALRVANLFRIVERWVPQEQRCALVRHASEADGAIAALFAVDEEAAGCITSQLLYEYGGIVVQKSACDALAAIAQEAAFVATTAQAMANGYPIVNAERQRLYRASARIRAALEIART